MSDRRFSLLDDPLIGIDLIGDRKQVCLPDLLSLMGSRQELEFTRMRAHQHHAWYAFLVQIGALVLHGKGISSLEMSSSEWREGLQTLAGALVLCRVAWMIAHLLLVVPEKGHVRACVPQQARHVGH